MCNTIYGYAPRLIYTISLRRYPSYYYASAIIPNLVITAIALLALFIDDINSRLAVAITALLAIVAVMVGTFMFCGAGLHSLLAAAHSCSVCSCVVR